MLDGINVFEHSSIRIAKDKVIYIDPFRIAGNYNDADIIFITHSHYDHFSEDDILKVKKDDTKIVITKDLFLRVKDLGFKDENIFLVKVGECYKIDDLEFETVFSYNINTDFHPKSNGWVGYILVLNNIRYYIAGDTDIVEENINIKCDVCFLPIGGTYTMNYLEAFDYCNIINPKVVVPIHYGSIVGQKSDGQAFKKLFEGSNIECLLLIK